MVGSVAKVGNGGIKEVVAVRKRIKTNILEYFEECPPMRGESFRVCCVQVEMLYRTNLVALVSGGRKPKFAENTVMIYDDNSGKMVSGGWWRAGHVTSVLTSDWWRAH